jgi:FlaA1/EpsC-like NDP-sugar epimerase
MNRVTPKLLESAQHQAVENRIAPSLERRRLRAYAMMVVADGVLFNFSFALAALLWEGWWWEPRSMLAAQAMLPVFFTIALYNGAYSVTALRDWMFAARKAVIALMISAALINFVGFYTKSNEDFSRAAVTLGLLFTVIMLAAFRRMVPVIIAHRWGGRVTNRLVIDDGGSSFAFEGAEVISALRIR